MNIQNNKFFTQTSPPPNEAAKATSSTSTSKISELRKSLGIHRTTSSESTTDVSQSSTSSTYSRSHSRSPELEGNPLLDEMSDAWSDSEGSPRGKLNMEIEVNALQTGMDAEEISKILKPLFEKLIKKVPAHALSLNENVGRPPSSFEHNNYGITPDPQTEIQTVDDHIEFYVRGEKKSIPARQAYTDFKQVFSIGGGTIFADAATATGNAQGCHSFVIADGCGWGKSAQQAAMTAATLSLRIIVEKLNKQPKSTTRDIAKIHLKALQKVQKDLFAQGDETGTTTALLATIADSFLVVTKIGDCGLSILRKDSLGKQRCINLADVSTIHRKHDRDPGGRLGLYNDGEDWRNLAITVVKLKPNDLIIGYSDGVSDNFDLEKLGLTPVDFGWDEEEWDDQNSSLLRLRLKMQNKKFTEVVGTDRDQVASRIIDHVSRATLKTKIFLLENPREKEPSNYKEYPGKQDHVSVVVFKYEPLKKIERAVSSRD